MRLLNYNKK